VRHVFRIARQVAPTVIFFDQLDAIAPVRGAHEGSMTTERVVSQLLAELDGVEQLSRVIVIGATNRIDLVDSSILRPGRFGMHIHVPLPDDAARRAIVEIHLGSPDMEVPQIAEIAAAVAAETGGFSGAQLRQICQEAKRLALRAAGFTRSVPPTLADVLDALKREVASKDMDGRETDAS
jgi:transitional endoplasmic reticulum ATPase